MKPHRDTLLPALRPDTLAHSSRNDSSPRRGEPTGDGGMMTDTQSATGLLSPRTIVGAGSNETSTCITPRRLLQRQQHMKERGTHLSPASVGKGAPPATVASSHQTTPQQVTATSGEQVSTSSERAGATAGAADGAHTEARPTPPLLPGGAMMPIKGLRHGTPKDYADLKNLRDLPPTLLYSALLADETFRKWCDPLQPPTRPNGARWQEYDCYAHDGAEEEEEEEPVMRARGESDDNSAPAAYMPSVGLPCYTTGAAPQGPVADAEDFSDDEDDEADDPATRVAKAEHRIARQTGDMRRAVQQFHQRRDRFYARSYAEGQRQQALARREVEAYGKELGPVEAVSQLTPSTVVDTVLQEMSQDPTRCEDIFDDAVAEDFLIREMHMAVTRMKLRHQVDTELLSGHQHLTRACDIHLAGVGTAEGQS